MFRVVAIMLVCFFISLMSCSAKKTMQGKPSVESSDSAKDKESSLINERSIHEKIMTRIDGFKKCFDEEMARNETFKIKKVMSLFTLSKEGSVLASGVVSVHQVTQEFKDCFRNIISSIKFPPVSSDKPVLVFYPVEYRSVKD